MPHHHGRWSVPDHSIKSGSSPAPSPASFKYIASAYAPSPKNTPCPRLRIPPHPHTIVNPSASTESARKRPKSERLYAERNCGASASATKAAVCAAIFAVLRFIEKPAARLNNSSRPELDEHHDHHQEQHVRQAHAHKNLRPRRKDAHHQRRQRRARQASQPAHDHH